MAARPDDLTTLTRPDADPTRRIPPATVEDIEFLAERASEILAEALTAALEPANSKVLRSWNLKEVSELLGLSRKTLERAIEEGKIPGGTVARGRRMFTLEEIHTVQEKLGLRPWRDPKTDPPVVVAVANFKGGVAKTSTAVHLGQYLALKGYRTLMIDIDAQGSLTTLFGLRPDADIQASQTLAPWLRRACQLLKASGAISETTGQASRISGSEMTWISSASRFAAGLEGCRPAVDGSFFLSADSPEAGNGMTRRALARRCSSLLFSDS